MLLLKLFNILRLHMLPEHLLHRAADRQADHRGQEQQQEGRHHAQHKARKSSISIVIKGWNKVKKKLIYSTSFTLPLKRTQ